MGGTIPARAGETPAINHHALKQRDHPRSRGGNSGACIGKDGWQGPSPLARGKPGDSLERGRAQGTIPARAGETVFYCLSEHLHWDHPRSRGGNLMPGDGDRVFAGPSPLARGKPKLGTKFTRKDGTIPARAGETSTAPRANHCAGDHPRSRGGNGISPRCATPSTGPSPLARGKRWLMRLAWMTSGTIPARAGET